MQGKIINGYTLKERLGVGGMAEVWLGENAIGKKAAVKLLLPKFCNDEAIVARFENEAKVMVQLDHPNIRQVYDYGNINGRPTIIMEYLEGDDLKALMKSGRRFTDNELRKWWDQIVDALNYTHAKGIVHRDIKPSNIFINKKGDVKLLDFGIAKIKESLSMTQTGAMMGTLLYMSPEQVEDSKHIGPESDVYSLAVTFVHLLTGKAPYDSTTSSDYAIRKGIVEMPLDLSDVPTEWQGFLAQYLKKRPEDRPALRPFEAVPLPEKDEMPQPVDDDEGTVVENVKKPDPKPVKTEEKTPEPTNKPKSKKGLWIGLGVAVVVAIAAFLFLRQPKPVPADPETEEFLACKTVADYRAYLSNYGHNAVHYAEAQHIMDSLVADSMAIVVQDSLARAQVVAESQKVKEEDEAYQKCTTVAGCDKYLKNYPQGRYVAEVQAKKATLAISITTTKNSSNIVYRGIDNPVAIAGISGMNYNVTAEGGTLKTDNDRYILHVDNNAKKVQVNVSSDGSLIKSVEFTVKDIPNPTPMIRNTVNGMAMKTAFLAAGRVEVELKNCNYNGVYFNVVGYTCRYKTAAGTIKEEKTNSNEFTDGIKAAINAAHSGDTFMFFEIKVKGNDGKVRTLDDSIAVMIK